MQLVEMDLVVVKVVNLQANPVKNLLRRIDNMHLVILDTMLSVKKKKSSKGKSRSRKKSTKRLSVVNLRNLK